MELDTRQGDLFMRLLQGGKEDTTYPNYRKKIDERGKEPDVQIETKRNTDDG